MLARGDCGAAGSFAGEALAIAEKSWDAGLILVLQVAVPAALYAIGMTEVAALFALLSVIVFVKHRANIGRLLSGTETRIGAKG